MAILKFICDANQIDNEDGSSTIGSTIEYTKYPTNAVAQFLAPPATTDLWISWGQTYRSGQQTKLKDTIQITDQDGVSIITAGWIGAGYGLTVQGGARQTTGNDAGTGSVSNFYRFDMHIDTVGGAVELYIEGNLVGAWTGTFTGVTSIGGISWQDAGNSSYGTQIYTAFMADEDSRPIFMEESYPTANGALSGWAGDETLIDGTTRDDAQVLVSNTAEQTSVFVTGDLPAAYAGGYEIMGFGVAARARVIGAGGPRSLAVAVRSGTTVGNGDTKALAGGFKSYQSMITLDPNTGAAWTYAAINAAQIGVTSKA
jgi:hypothetical protein